MTDRMTAGAGLAIGAWIVGIGGLIFAMSCRHCGPTAGAIGGTFVLIALAAGAIGRRIADPYGREAKKNAARMIGASLIVVGVISLMLVGSAPPQNGTAQGALWGFLLAGFMIAEAIRLNWSKLQRATLVLSATAFILSVPPIKLVGAASFLFMTAGVVLVASTFRSSAGSLQNASAR